MVLMMRLEWTLLRVIALFAFLCLVTDATGQPKDIPFPPDVVIVPPSVEVQKELAAFSGKWFAATSMASTPARTCPTA